jgi:hypothetical protein
MVCEFGDPTVTLPKPTVDGVVVINGCVPVPVRAIVRLGFEPLLVTAMLPEALAAEAGVNVAVSEALCPVVNVKGSASAEILKPVPDTVDWEIVTLAVPLFVRDTV